MEEWVEDWKKLESLKRYIGACTVESDPHPSGSAITASCSRFLLVYKMEREA